jgi:hypothetical protein
VRRHEVIGLGFIGVLTAGAAAASLSAIARDARNGNPDPWWAYLIPLGIVLGLAGTVFVVLRITRAQNLLAAELDAPRDRRDDAGDEPSLEQVHPLFGRIDYQPSRGWKNAQFELWNRSNVVLLLAADASGPTPMQEKAFVSFRDARERLLPMCLTAVAAERAGTGRPSGVAVISALSIPSLLASDARNRTSGLWTLWFDYEGEDHWSYGVQSSDDWATIRGFAED